MSNKKLNGFKFFQKFLDKLSKAAKKFAQPETIIVEARLNHFFDLPEAKQCEIIKHYLTKNL